ncbi:MULTISPECIES: Ger(x)C family spore germination protein [Bacillus cereus group]|uniref:Ger(x)C family spore germination protein n=1 Tax=Bacillus cereus group TaxID=86661 RepID=UPI0003133366|nr:MULTISPECIES: Ger(x)C family spore germination protein [Bacillus cereus group]MEB9673858.1 Ger(x)C family spore germination protein [Bacillus anthracis]
MKPITYLIIFILLLCIFPFHIEKPVPIEDTSFTLAFGIDINHKGELIFYSSNPVFNMEAKETKEILKIKAQTGKQVQEEIDKRTTGLNILSKIQVVLIGKNLLSYRDWPSLLDFMYRDFKSAVTPLLIVVDGPVSEVMYFSPKNKPRISLHLKSLITSAKLRGITVGTSLQEFHRQLFEKGITPTLPNIKKSKEIFLTGSKLLTKDGLYKTSLNTKETSLLQILQSKKVSYFSNLTYSKSTKSHVIPEVLSFVGRNQKTRVTSVYRNGKFKFNYHIYMKITLSECTNCFKKELNHSQLEHLIKKNLEKQFQMLIKKIQNHKIDPIGLGIQARAFHNEKYKQVQNKWGETLSNANIGISLHIELENVGAIK